MGEPRRAERGSRIWAARPSRRRDDEGEVVRDVRRPGSRWYLRCGGRARPGYIPANSPGVEPGGSLGPRCLGRWAYSRDPTQRVVTNQVGGRRRRGRRLTTQPSGG